ncbi:MULTISPECIES: hydrogenase maturation nickel metallochaperone HypA [Lachnospiraceae]|uniref:Hydrogenase maturation nickel metallochaperone HypA n=1 Tax=Faecalicatena acetigenes TaxID=2981790 RepID=A0ABT2T951_9FIRM|nr:MULTISPECIES: hydrogenase maturation nickel metallochaperone HypA [Lachnospiraceae]MCU6746767.1 hydrogenase maturation nickel metallochaperone HypA [Faecalicatena acetigenes]RGT74588.1 hydrogenase maturation nickel metallochaperone HypA [Ruminococcus sp. AF18-22]SCH40595.1 Probable hydrogenase nickel incorporation protein hypA [uncultured Clostridium sp.]
MHELGIVFHIMDSLEKIGKENQLSEIANVTLEIGEVSGVVDAYLKDCWKWAVRKSDLLKKAELITETIEAVTFCEDCGSTYSTVKYGKICPYCQSGHTYLAVGNEFNIKEIEAR